MAEGIGEELTELPQMMRCPVLIAKPPISVSTKYVYEHLDAIEDPVHPDIDAMIADITAGRPACVGIPYGQYLRGCDYSEISGDRTDQGVDAAEWSRGFHDERQWSDRLWFF